MRPYPTPRSGVAGPEFVTVELDEAAGREAPDVALACVSPEAAEREVRVLVEALRARGFAASVFDVGHGVIAIEGIGDADLDDLVRGHRAIARVARAATRYRLVRRDVVPEGSVVAIGDVAFGGPAFPVIAGPCAVEGRASVLRAARAAAAAGAAVLRGGAFKPRTSPYDFQGLGLHGAELLAEAGKSLGLPVVTEVMSPGAVEDLYPLTDAFQVGARSMHNFDLLRALGDVDKPVVLKRGFSATVDEWLLAAEYLLAGGNGRVILCERGIRTFEPRTRFTLDLAGMALAKRETHLPVIVDPSHATGDPSLVGPMALAALAAGADGVMVEVHPDPEEALSDGSQALLPAALADLIARLAEVAPAFGRHVAPGPRLRNGRASA